MVSFKLFLNFDCIITVDDIHLDHSVCTTRGQCVKQSILGGRLERLQSVVGHRLHKLHFTTGRMGPNDVHNGRLFVHACQREVIFRFLQ